MPVRSRARIATVVAGMLLVFANTSLVSAATDVKVTDQTYVRFDGGSDSATTACSTNNRQQNEPSAAVNPNNGDQMVSGANDYCTVPTFGGTWAGFYYTNDGGASWTNSLLPGYPTDTTEEGQASPLFGLVNNAGDPVQAWDNDGHVYYAGIGFNRAKPASGSLWVARYDWSSGAAPDYEFTTLAARGTPSPIFLGLFHDKILMEVDRGANSPHDGNVYVCWARFTASGPNNGVFFVRSTDGGQTFSNPMKISDNVHGSQFCDIAVTSDGTVFVAWRQFAFKPDRGQRQNDAVAWAKSTNGGAKFTKPEIATELVGWDPGDQTVSASAYGAAKFAACQAGDGTLGSCAGPDPRATARDCGDGPLACQSGYVFFRVNTQVRITADPAGDPDEVFVVYDASVPGTDTPTGTTYGTRGSGTGSQASVYFTTTSNGGGSWTAPSRIDSQEQGHQFFPDIDAVDGRLHAVYHDSRIDDSTGPAGGDFRTVPISNQWVATNPPGATSGGPGLETYYATSADDGATWAAQVVSTAAQMPQYEMFGDRDVPFHGDYNYISAADGRVFMAWADTRDVVAGTDPRYPVDGTDGFDVNQCRTQGSDGTWSADTCPNAGGLDQNIYGTVLAAP
jgi:hypothetical protein